jgi:hypothetical protein
MDAWWWVPVILVAWFAVAVAVGLWLGPVLRYCSQAREALEPHMEEIPEGIQEPAPVLAAGRLALPSGIRP